jgi:hypothetical protein
MAGRVHLVLSAIQLSMFPKGRNQPLLAGFRGDRYHGWRPIEGVGKFRISLFIFTAAGPVHDCKRSLLACVTNVLFYVFGVLQLKKNKKGPFVSTNKERTARAQHALEAYLDTKGENLNWIEEEAPIVDLVTDLLHLASTNEFDIETITRRAEIHFHAEHEAELKARQHGRRIKTEHELNVQGRSLLEHNEEPIVPDPVSRADLGTARRAQHA